MPKVPTGTPSSEGAPDAQQPPATTIEHLLTDDPLKLLAALDGHADLAWPHSDAVLALVSSLQSLAPRMQTGAELYAELRDHVRILPSGCDALDSLLRGGLRETLVTELCGESSAGKTQICHLAALTTAHRGERVLYFDTTNSFSPQRLSQLHSHLAAAAAAAPAAGPPTPPLPSLPATLTHITVLRPHSYHSLARQLDELADQMGQLADPSARPSLLIIDSLSALISPVLGSRQHNQGHALLACIGRSLKSMADTFRLAVLLTSHMVSAGGADGRTRPAMGEQWRGQPHVRVGLRLAPERGAGARCLQLTSCTFSEVGQTAWCQLGAAGALSLQP